VSNKTFCLLYFWWRSFAKMPWILVNIWQIFGLSPEWNTYVSNMHVCYLSNVSIRYSMYTARSWHSISVRHVVVLCRNEWTHSNFSQHAAPGRAIVVVFVPNRRYKILTLWPSKGALNTRRRKILRKMKSPFTTEQLDLRGRSVATMNH